VDPKLIISDPEMDPSCQVIMDPDLDPAFQAIKDLYAHPYQTFQFISDPDHFRIYLAKFLQYFRS